MLTAFWGRKLQFIVLILQTLFYDSYEARYTDRFLSLVGENSFTVADSELPGDWGSVR